MKETELNGINLLEQVFQYTKIMRIYYFFICFVLIVITSCESNVQRIIKHQDEIIALGQSKEIINDRERSFYMLTTYNPDDKMWNEYNFEKMVDDGKVLYSLRWDSIQFSPDDIININKNDSRYQKEICNYFLNASQILKTYGIKSLSGEIYKNSPKLTIYLEGGGILIYQPNIVSRHSYNVANNMYLWRKKTSW